MLSNTNYCDRKQNSVCIFPQCTCGTLVVVSGCLTEGNSSNHPSQTTTRLWLSISELIPTWRLCLWLLQQHPHFSYSSVLHCSGEQRVVFKRFLGSKFGVIYAAKVCQLSIAIMVQCWDYYLTIITVSWFVLLFWFSKGSRDNPTETVTIKKRIWFNKQ